MSLPFISETAAEVHRLAIAGSSLAASDYRLKKLVPSLEGLAAKAPIFGRIAAAVNSVVGGGDATISGRALLDLSSLLTAIQYTQSPHEVKGEFIPLESTAKEWVPTMVTHRSLSAVVQALTNTGQGRMEIVRDALERGLFKDLRLMKPAVEALHDNYGEMSELVAREVLPKFGPAVIGMLLEGFDPKGGKPHARRVTALCGIDPETGREFCRKVLESANKEVKLAVIEGLTGSQEDLETILDLTKERSGDVRKAAILALKGMKDQRVVDLVKKALDGKDAMEAAVVAASFEDSPLLDHLLEQAKDSLKLEPRECSERLACILRALRGSQNPEVLKTLIEIRQEMAKTMESEYSFECRGLLAGALFEINSEEADNVLIEFRSENRKPAKKAATPPASPSKPVVAHPSMIGHIRNGLCYSLAAAARRMDAEAIFDCFSSLYEKSTEWEMYSELLQGKSIWSYHGVACPGLPEEKISPRWIALGIKKGDSALVAKIAKLGDATALKFLLTTDAKELKGQGYYGFPLASAIVRLDPENAPKYIIEGIVTQQKKQPSHAYWAGNLFSLIVDLPASKIPELESLAVALEGPWKARFDECIAEMRHLASRK